MKKLNLSIIVFILPFMLAAQTNVDSLVNVLETRKLTAEEELAIYEELCAEYKDVNKDSLGKYADRGMLLAEKERNEAMLTAFYRYLGISNFQNQQYDSAASYLNKTLELALKRKDREDEAAAYLAMGYMNSSQSNIKMMLEYQFKALTLFETLGNREKTMEALASIGDAYRRDGNTEMAIKYLDRAKDMTGESTNAFLNALIFYELGETVSDVKEVVEYESRAVEYARLANDKILEMLANGTLATTYMSEELHDSDKALEMAKEGYRIALELGADSYIYDALALMAVIYREKKDYKASEAVALEAWAMDSTNLYQARMLAKNIAIANIYLGNRDKASLFLTKYEELTDEYTAKSYRQDLIEMETKYDTEKKETRIATLEKTQKLYAGLIIAIALAALFIILYLRQRLKKKAAQATTEGVLEGEMKERERFATELHNGVQSALRKIRENLLESAAEVDNVIEEVQDISRGLMSKTLKMSGLRAALEDYCRGLPRVGFYFEGSEKRASELVENFLYRSAQELVTNSLKHAEAQEIEVHLLQDKKHIYLTVSDDGKGYDTAQETSGIGVRNIRTRAEALGGTMDVASSPGNGTETSITVKI